MDRGAWQNTVHGVAQSRTRLKLLSSSSSHLVAQMAKNLPATCGRPRLYPWEGNGFPLQCSCLGNPMDRGAWQNTVHGVAKSGTQLSG